MQGYYPFCFYNFIHTFNIIFFCGYFVFSLSLITFFFTFYVVFSFFWISFFCDVFLFSFSSISFSCNISFTSTWSFCDFFQISASSSSVPSSNFLLIFFVVTHQLCYFERNSMIHPFHRGFPYLLQLGLCNRSNIKCLKVSNAKVYQNWYL